MENNTEAINHTDRDGNLAEKLTTKANGHCDEVVYTSTDCNGKVNGDEMVLNPSKDQITATVPTNIAVPPDGGWGWVVVAASFFCNLVVDGITYSFGIFLPILVDDLKESKAKVSLIISLMSGCYLIAGPFASALANRFGFRRVSMIGSVMAGTAFFISSYAPNTTFLYVTYGVIGGVGFGLVFVPAVIALGFYFEKWRALATGIAVCGSGIGTFVMAPISSWLIARYGWRGALIVQAGTGGVIYSETRYESKSFKLRPLDFRMFYNTFTGFLFCCALCGVLFRPLKPITVQIEVAEEAAVVEENENEHSKAKRPSLILKPEFLQNLNSNGKSKSLLNIYEDLGVTVEEMHTKNEQRRYFNNNNQYPTVSQILQLKVVLDGSENCSTFNNSDSNNLKFRPPSTNGTRERQLMVLSNRELNTNPHEMLKPSESNGSKTRERNNSLTPNVAEKCILLNDKHSLQQHYKSQSFTIASTTTLASHKSNTLNRRHTDMNNRPLYRDDIFFSSTLNRIPTYASQASSLNYTMSVTRLPTTQDLLEEKKKKFFIFPEAVRRALGTLLDVSLLRSPTFLVLALSGFLTSMGMYTPFMYINDRAKKFGLSDTEALWLIAVVGIANTLGRVGLGILSSIPRMNATIINNISMTLCGGFTMFSGLFETCFYQFFYATVFGLTIACFAALRPIMIVDLLGLDKLTNAFGLLLLFQGVAAVMGPPLAGFLVDVTGRYDIPFYISGALIVLSAVVCYPIESLNQWVKARNVKRNKSPI